MNLFEEINLRVADVADAKVIHTWYAEERIIKYAIIHPFLGFSLTEVQDHLKRWLGRDDRKLYIASSRNHGDFGLLFFENIDWKNRAAKIGVLIGDPDLRGHGLGQATLQKAIKMACGDWGLHRLGANCLTSNQAMIRALEKVGFEKEGLMREAVIKQGNYQDLLIYAYLCH